jgi:hypothetical protein
MVELSPVPNVTYSQTLIWKENCNFVPLIAFICLEEDHFGHIVKNLFSTLIITLPDNEKELFIQIESRQSVFMSSLYSAI